MVPHLVQSHGERAVVGADLVVLYLGVGSPKVWDGPLTPWTVAEARELRDWLNEALPEAKAS